MVGRLSYEYRQRSRSRLEVYAGSTTPRRASFPPNPDQTATPKNLNFGILERCFRNYGLLANLASGFVHARFSVFVFGPSLIACA